MSRDGSRQLAAYAAFFGAVCAVGTAVAFIPWEVTLTLIIAAVGVLGLAAARVALRPAGASVPLESAPRPVSDPRLHFARLVYYLGAATIGFLTVRPALGFTASDWIFLASLGLTALVLLVRGLRRDYLVPRAVTIGVILFALGGLLSSTNAVAPLQSAAVVFRMLYLTLIWFWLGTVVVQNRVHVENALVAWVGSAALSSSGAVAQFFEGDVIPGGDIAWGRMTGFTPHFNNLGGLAATAFVPALMLAVDGRSRNLRLVGAASAGLLVAGLLLSGSVGGLLAASVATIFWLAIRGLSLRLVVSAGVVVAAAFVLMSATGVTNAPNPIQRITRVTSSSAQATGTGGTVQTRLQGYGDAWSRLQEQPFIGVGLDVGSSEQFLGEHPVHNIILNPWFSAGIFGLVGILFLVGGAFSCGLKALRYSPARDRAFVAGPLAALVAFVVFAMGEPILFVRYGWFPAALLIALRAQQIRARAPARQVARSARPVLTYSPSEAR